MIKPVLSTVFDGVAIHIKWVCAKKAYQLCVGANSIMCGEQSLTAPHQSKFTVNHTDLTLKITVYPLKETDIVGIYRQGIPYKLAAFRWSDERCVSVSETALA